MIKTLPLLAAPALLLAGCAATTPPAAEAPATPAATCDAAPAQALLGTTATEAASVELLKLSGARELRWAPPRRPLTMDYRHDRLTVAYDDAMKITQITCG